MSVVCSVGCCKIAQLHLVAFADIGGMQITPTFRLPVEYMLQHGVQAKGDVIHDISVVLPPPPLLANVSFVERCQVSYHCLPGLSHYLLLLFVTFVGFVDVVEHELVHFVVTIYAEVESVIRPSMDPELEHEHLVHGGLVRGRSEVAVKVSMSFFSFRQD